MVRALGNDVCACVCMVIGISWLVEGVSLMDSKYRGHIGEVTVRLHTLTHTNIMIGD